MKFTSLLALLIYCLDVFAQTANTGIANYSFGDYRLETGHCDYYSKLEVFYRDSSLARFCDGEGGMYSSADTININNDGRPDFVCAHAQEDGYSYLVLLISNKEGYRFVDPDIYASELAIFHDKTLNADEPIREFAVVDADGDKRQDIVVNVYERDGVLFPVSSFVTDTILHDLLVWHATEFDTNSYWLPEKYVEAVVTGDTGNANNYLFPIAALFDPFGRCYVKAYRSDPVPQLMDKMAINGVTRYKLRDLHNKIPLDAEPPVSNDVYISMKNKRRLLMRPYAERLGHSVVSIIKKGEMLLLEITDAAGTEQIYFINRYDGKQLTPANFPLRYYYYAR